jgi:biotin synthase
MVTDSALDAPVGIWKCTWTRDEIAALFDLPFLDLVAHANAVHRENHPANEVQLSTLLSIKTGGCIEDCGYCSQSAHHDTGLKATKLMEVQQVLQAAAQAKDHGSTRFCMGAAWRNPKDKDIPALAQMIRGVREMGLETCMTLGMLTPDQARKLGEAGLDYYNHNIDTSPENYANVISTRTFEDRIETLEHVRGAGINVCSGGIMGMGETRADRVGFLHALATLPVHPGSVPINALVPVAGTVLGDILKDVPSAKIDDIEFVRTVAVARITMPQSMVRLSAGRERVSDTCQALCFMAGANSIFTGDKLLTTGNAGDDRDAALFAKLGIVPMKLGHPQHAAIEPMGIA